MSKPAQEKSRQTPDQRRANHAWNAVQSMIESKGKDSDDAKKFGRQAKNLPTRIMASGLGQALAFLYAKDYAPQLLCALGDWVLEKHRNPHNHHPPLQQKDALLRAIVEGTSDDLRRYTDEALAYLVWLTRFAEAEGLTQQNND